MYKYSSIGTLFAVQVTVKSEQHCHASNMSINLCWSSLQSISVLHTWLQCIHILKLYSAMHTYGNGVASTRCSNGIIHFD